MAEKKVDPWNPELHFALGIAIENQGQLERAVTHYKQAHRGRPERNDFRVVLARAHQGLGQLTEALGLWVDLARFEAHQLEAYLRMADICIAMGQPQEAEGALKQAVLIRPEEDPAWLNLAQLQLAAGRDEEAAESLQQLIHLRPDLHQVHNELGRIHLRAGRLDAAEACFVKAIEIKSDYGLAYNNLASLLQQLKRTDEALSMFEKARSLQEEPLAALEFNHAHCLSQLGRVEDARVGFRALRGDPDVGIRALWAELSSIAVVLQTTQQANEERDRFEACLERIEQAMDAAGDDVNPAHFDPILPSFHLHYHHCLVRSVQKRYGALVHRAARTFQTQLASVNRTQSTSTKWSGKRRIRVGFISAHFRRHTVNKLFSGWVRELDRSQFDVSVYHLGHWLDLDSRSLALDVTLHHVPGQIHQTAARIMREQFDVLIYPEVGMDADVLRLASLRLAPLQCMAWGHPVTSGLPTIDVFLSSEAMEPEPASDQYTEELVCLPGLSVCLKSPAKLSDGLERGGMNLPSDRVIVLSCQTLSKYRPEHDFVWADIAQQCPEALICFIVHPSAVVTEAFGVRLARLFEARSMRLADHVRFLPRLSEGAYHDLNRMSDVYLDSIGWSGGNTTIEAIYHGLPVVTMPGKTMRSRHTAGILQHVGLSHLIASDEKDYVARACRLIGDAEHRAEIRNATQAAAGALWGDLTPVRALESFLKSRVTESQ